MLPEDTPNPPEGFEWKDSYLTKKKKKSFMEKGSDSLKNMTKNMKTGDWIFLLGTLGLAAANPKGRGGQAKVIQHNLDKSTELGAATAKSALSRVRNYVIPKLEKTETDVIEMISSYLWFSIFLGIFANDMQRWFLEKKDFQLLDLIFCKNKDSALIKFLSRKQILVNY
mgnify:CR=1 FL=1